MLTLTMQIYSEFITINYLSPPIRAQQAYEPTVEVSQETYNRHLRIWEEFKGMQDELIDIRAKFTNEPLEVRVPPIDNKKVIK